MSDKVKRGAQPTTGGSDGNKFSAKLLKIVSEFEQLRKDNDGLQAYAKLCENQTALKQDLEKMNKEIEKKDDELHLLAEQKDEEIATLQKTISASQQYEDRLLQTYDTRFRNWDAESKRHSADSTQISKLKRELETSRKATEDANNQKEQLRISLDGQIQQNSELEERASSLSNSYKRKELDLNDTQILLDKYQKRFQTAKHELGILQSDQHKL
jgi:chromosome segregation ATPase